MSISLSIIISLLTIVLVIIKNSLPVGLAPERIRK
jgi:hypothetical protein